MKKIISIVILIISLSSLHAEKGIVVTQKWTRSEIKDAVMTVTWYVTATQCKMKLELHTDKVNTTTWFIPDLANGALLTYLDAQSGNKEMTYYSIPLGKLKSSPIADVSRINTVKTGEMQNMSGAQSEKMTVKTNRNTTEMWVTSDFKTDFYKYYPFFQSSFPLLALNNDNIQGFPLSSITRDISGNVVSSDELVSVTQTDLSNSDFSVPSEYKLVK